ncbi:unnamed protein product [Calypogeia fissa]
MKRAGPCFARPRCDLALYSTYRRRAGGESERRPFDRQRLGRGREGHRTGGRGGRDPTSGKERIGIIGSTHAHLMVDGHVVLFGTQSCSSWESRFGAGRPGVIDLVSFGRPSKMVTARETALSIAPGPQAGGMEPDPVHE